MANSSGNNSFKEENKIFQMFFCLFENYAENYKYSGKFSNSLKRNWKIMPENSKFSEK